MERTAKRAATRGLAGAGAAGGVLAVLLSAGTPPATAAVEDEAFACGAKEVHGVAPGDADTAVGLVCAELRRESGGRGRFEVSLGTLGRLVILKVEGQEPAQSVTARLEGIEEVPVAAPRIARALVRREPFPATQRVDNLLEDETRVAPAKRGSVKFAAGVADVETPGFGARGTGFSLGLQYATPRFALPVDLRFAFDDAQYGEPQVDLFSVSVGGRGFLSTRDVSPFAGGGLGMVWLHASRGADFYDGASVAGYFDADTLLVAPYVEAGVEALRLHRGRVAVFVRADLPLSSLKSPEIRYQDWDPDTDAPGAELVIPGASRYVVPVSIGVSVAF
jgi:hypothetical protein